MRRGVCLPDNLNIKPTGMDGKYLKSTGSTRQVRLALNADISIKDLSYPKGFGYVRYVIPNTTETLTPALTFFLKDLNK